MRNAVSLFALAALAASAPAAPLQAGASARKITPALEPGKPVYIAGFDSGRAATGVHDDLWVRCLALSTGGKPVALCAVDTIGLFYEDVQKIRARVPGAQVIVASTHDHEGPDTMGQWGAKQGVSGLSEAHNAFIVSQAVAAIEEAVHSLQLVTAYPAAITPKDVATYYHDSRPPVVQDPEILSLVLKGKNGKTVATLVNWNNHPEALGSKNTLITSDWPHALRSTLEANGFGTVVFMNGAVGGMQSPLNAKITDPKTGQLAPEDTFRFAEVVGEYAAGNVIASQKQAKKVAIDGITYRETLLRIPVTNQAFMLGAKLGLFGDRKPMAQDRATSTPVGYLALTSKGKPVVEVALIPGELYPELSVGGAVRDPNADFPDAPMETPVKKMMSAPYRMLFGLANDEIGYIIPKCQWDETAPYTFGATHRWYGEVNSIGPDAAPAITSALQTLINTK